LNEVFYTAVVSVHSCEYIVKKNRKLVSSRTTLKVFAYH